MFLFALGRKLEFLPVRLMIHGNGITNLFAKKNNKTVAEIWQAEDTHDYPRKYVAGIPIRSMISLASFSIA